MATRTHSSTTSHVRIQHAGQGVEPGVGQGYWGFTYVLGTGGGGIPIRTMKGGRGNSHLYWKRGREIPIRAGKREGKCSFVLGGVTGEFLFVPGGGISLTPGLTRTYKFTLTPRYNIVSDTFSTYLYMVL